MDTTHVTETEIEGLYKLAVAKTDALEIASEALAMLGRNTAILSASERLRLRELHERMAVLG